jgi:hypothetical protein
VSTRALDFNAVRFNPVLLAGHVESYFLKANDRSGERAIWIKATIFASVGEPLHPVAEGWAIAFDRRGGKRHHVAVKHSLPFEAGTFNRRELGVHWKLPAAPGVAEGGNELTLTPGETSGLVSAPEHQIGWKLRFSTTSAPLIHFPFPAMYEGAFPKSKLCSPYPDARFDGEVVVDGERWDLADWPGMQGHNWGKGHAESYAWCHSNTWEEDDQFLLEGFSGKVAVGPIRTPLITLICVRHRGTSYDFNLPVDLIRSSGDIGARRWEFSAKNGRARIEGSVEAPDEDFVGLHYPNPDGPMTYCLNTKLASARVRFQPKGSAPLSLTSPAAALEIGTRDPHHGVRMYV